MTQTCDSSNSGRAWSVQVQVARFLAVMLAMTGALVALPASAEPVEQGTFSGTVLLPDGTPAAGVTVEVIDGERWYEGPRVDTTTAPDGTYSVNTAPGNYMIRFVDPSGDHLWSVPGATTSENDFPHGASTELASGATVSVDHTLVASGSVRGQLTLPADVKPDDVSVTVWYPRRPMGMAPRTPAQFGGPGLDADGTFAIPLRDGAYIVDIEHRGELFGGMSLPVRVTDGNIRRLDLAPRRSGSISGVVQVPEGSDTKDVRVTALTNAGIDGADVWTERRSIEVKAGEPYMLGGLGTGSYRVEFAPVGESNLAPTYWSGTWGGGEEVDEVAVLDGSDRPGVNGELVVADVTDPKPTPDPKPALKTIERLKAPKVTGKTELGRTLKVSKGTWKPRSVKVTYRWFSKKGDKVVKVKSTKKPTLKLKRSTLGKRYRVVVTVSKPGYRTVKHTTKWSKKIKR